METVFGFFLALVFLYIVLEWRLRKARRMRVRRAYVTTTYCMSKRARFERLIQVIIKR